MTTNPEENDLIKRILISKVKPDSITDLQPRELADLVLVVLQYVKEINQSIKDGKIRGERGDDGYSPKADVDYISFQTASKEINKVYNLLADKIDGEVKKALAKVRNGKDGKNGKDAVITKAIIREIAEMALSIIELPDFRIYITEQPEAIRNALELLQDEDRLKMSAIAGLNEEFVQLRKQIGTQSNFWRGKNSLAFLNDVNIDGAQNGYVLKYNTSTKIFYLAAESGAGSVVWGDIGGTLANQTDLQSALDGKSDVGHSHTESDITDLTHYTTSDFNTDFATKTQDDLGDGTTYKQYSATEKSKLAGIEDNADVTDATNVDAAGAVMNADTSTAAMQFVIDEDDMSSDSATKVPTQQSVKAYVDAQIGGGGYTDEMAQDAVGGILVDSAEIDFTYNDATPSITASIVAGSIDESKLDASVNASLDLADSALQSSAIGSTIQAFDDFLDDIAALTDPNADRLLFWDDSAGAIVWLTLGSGLSITDTTINASATLADGDYGDITVGSSGTTLTIDNDAVTYAKIQNVSATSRILGRITTGAGDIEELTAANVFTILGITSSAAELNILDGVTASTAEINHLVGVTSAIQTQLNAKAGTALSNLASVAINTSLISDTDVTDDLGSQAIRWNNVYTATVSTGDTAGDTLKLRGYDVNGTTYIDILTITANDTVTADLHSSVTINGSAIAYAGGAFHDGFSDFVANEHIDHTGVTLTAGAGLTGGGDISANRTFTVGAGTGITVNADDVAVNQANAFAWTAAHTWTVAGNTSRFINSSDSASVQVARFEGDRATMADNDEAYISLMLSNDAGTQTEFARLTWVATDVNAGTSVDGAIDFATVSAGSLADRMRLNGTNLSPSTNDLIALGTTSLGWSDLHLASGALINVANGNAVITHSSGIFTVSTGDLRVTTAGTNTASVVTVGGTQTLTSKTLTSARITTDVAPTSNDGATLGTSSLGFADLYLATGGHILVNNANPRRTIILTAAGGSPTTTIGCGGPTKVEAGTNDIDYWVLEFDTTTEERAFWVVQMPDNYDGSTVTARFIWTNAGGASTETVRWGIKARGYADSDAIDQAYGSEVTVDDTWLAQGDIHISSESSAITIGGSPAGGRPVIFNVGRKVANDNMAGDARLIAVQIEYGINAYSD